MFDDVDYCVIFYQSLLICEFLIDVKLELEGIFCGYGVWISEDFFLVCRWLMVCVVWLICGLVIIESEWVFLLLIDELEIEIVKLGFEEE